MKRVADDYAREVFGSKRYSPWLCFYTLVRGEFKEGWIPRNFYEDIILPIVNKKIRLCDSKTFTDVVLKTDLLPNIAYYIDGFFYNRNFEIIPSENVQELIFASSAEVFIKHDSSLKGLGVKTLAKYEFSQMNFQTFGNCVIQSAIKQNEYFESIIHGPVATIRITTVKDKSGKIDMRAAYLRLGRKNTRWVQSENAVRIAIINKSGELDMFGYTPDWKRWSEHPDTGVSFANKYIPKFKEAIEACVALHKKVPHITIIGWDVTIDNNDNVKIMEWNLDGPGIHFSEPITGPCFLGLEWEKLR